jgi:thiamine transporter
VHISLVLGELENDPAERMPMWYRPCEPEPGNTGGGKTRVKPTKENTVNNQYSSEFKNQSSFRNPRVLAEMAIFTALATVLSTIVIYVMPQGGSITLASMVPIIWLAIRRGPKVGLTTAVIYGCIQFAMLPYAIDPIQVLLDYMLAFGVLGVAGFFPKWPVVGTAVGVSLRFVMSFISGAVYWAPIYAPNVNPLIYSAVYNGSYMLPELVITVFAIFLLQTSKTLRVYL